MLEVLKGGLLLVPVCILVLARVLARELVEMAMIFQGALLLISTGALLGFTLYLVKFKDSMPAFIIWLILFIGWGLTSHFYISKM